MKRIAMRDFQLNAPKYLKDLPIELTRYGEVVAVVSAIDDKFEYVDIGKKINPEGFKVTPEEWKGEELSTSNPHLAVSSVPAAGHPVQFTLNRNFNVWVCPHNNESGQCPQGCVDTEIHKKTVKEVMESKSIAMCKHGSAYGNCKFGCRPGKETK